MPIAPMLEAERFKLLMTRNQMLDTVTGKLIGDIEDLFHTGIAYEVKQQQRKNLVFIESDDQTTEVLFKHYETLKGYRYNLDKFNQ